MDSLSFVDRSPNQKADKDSIYKSAKAIFRGCVKSEELGEIKKVRLNQYSLIDMIRGQATSENGTKKLLQMEGVVFIYQPEVSSFVNEGIELSIVSEEVPGEVEPLCSILFRASDYVKSVLNLQWTVNTSDISVAKRTPIYFTYRTLQNVHNIVLGRLTGGIMGHWKGLRDNIRTHKFSSPSGYTKIYPGEYALDISHIKYHYAGGSFIIQSSSDLREFKTFKNFLEKAFGTQENSAVFNILSRIPVILRNTVIKIMNGKGNDDDLKNLKLYITPMEANIHVPSVSYKNLIEFTREEVSTLTYFNVGDEIEEPSHLYGSKSKQMMGTRAEAPMF